MALTWKTYAGAQWAQGFESNRVTWLQAKQRCEDQGSQLASIVSWDIQNWINTEFGTQYNVWIGGSDSETEGTLKWVRGEAWQYANWDSCPSSNNNGNKDCVKIKQNGNGKWNFAKERSRKLN